MTDTFRVILLCLLAGTVCQARFLTDTYNGGRGTNFNTGWKFHLGDVSGAHEVRFDDAGWRDLDIPHDWSIELAYDRNSPAADGG